MALHVITASSALVMEKKLQLVATVVPFFGPRFIVFLVITITVVLIQEQSVVVGPEGVVSRRSS